MIYPSIAYSADKNIGKYYNNFLNMIPDNDWACFLDHDAMFTTLDWYSQLQRIIANNPDGGLFSACTNRIFNTEQIVFPKTSQDAYNHDIAFHRRIGLERQKKYDLEVKVAKNYISGVVMLISKNAWKKTSGCKDGFLGCDYDLHEKIKSAGFKIYIMTGVYVYHWYRADFKNLPPSGYVKELSISDIQK